MLPLMRTALPRGASWHYAPVLPDGSNGILKIKSSIRTNPSLLCMGLFSRFLLSGPEELGRDLSRHARDDLKPSPQLSTFSAAIKASCGMSTLPNCRIFFLPSFCFSRSLRLRVMSPP